MTATGEAELLPQLTPYQSIGTQLPITLVGARSDSFFEARRIAGN
jgi:hypothetical protein